MTAKLRYAGTFVGLMITYFATFLTVYIVRQQVAPGKIVFYSGLGMIAVALPVSLGGTYAVLQVIRKRGWAEPGGDALGFQHVFPAVIGSVLLGYAFVVTIASLLDRSISVFMIGIVAHAGEAGLSDVAIEEKFLSGYVRGERYSPKRLNEQLVSGNTEYHDGAYRLTRRGQFVYKTNVVLARRLNFTDIYANPVEVNIPPFGWV